MADVRNVVRIPLSGVAVDCHFYTFEGLSRSDHFAIRFGQPSSSPLVRVHSECITGDLFGSLRCDCGSQLQHAIRTLDEASGWLLYLRQEGRGIGLAAKLDAYVLQESGVDTFAANRRLGYGEDERDYQDAVGMLHALGLSDIRLMSNNREKQMGLARAGATVREVVPCPGLRSPFNANYLDAKASRNTSFDLSGVPAA